MRALAIAALIPLFAACPASTASPRSPRATPARPGPTATPTRRPAAPPPRRAPPAPTYRVPRRILAAEAHATPGGKAVLAAARQMITGETVVRGSCWDYAYAVYRRAGFGSSRKHHTVYRSRARGPYAASRLVQAGDWLYIVNHPASLATHSVIFVHWVDRAHGEAKVITYVGNRRDEPGMYRTYNVSRIYQIIRPRVPRPR